MYTNDAAFYPFRRCFMHDFAATHPEIERPPENHIQLMIGKVASLYGITVQTLRHYDKIG